MFFTAIHQMMTESVDLTIVIRKTNGQLTVSTLPKSNGLKDEAQNHIVPLTVTGTPQELDTGFLQAVTRPIQKTCGLISTMAQFEAQADKAAASSKAAKEAKSKETKEEREKREKYEKLMKKAEELTAARNHREAVSVLTQAKAHANAAQLKEIEEKIKAADTEMNRGSLFDLMEQEAQPEPSVQQQQPHSQQPAYTQAPEQRNPQPQRPQQLLVGQFQPNTAADIHAETVTADAGTGSARTAETTTGIHAASATARNMAVATTAAGKTADTAARAICPADRRTAAFPTSISAAA